MLFVQLLSCHNMFAPKFSLCITTSEMQNSKSIFATNINMAVHYLSISYILNMNLFCLLDLDKSWKAKLCVPQLLYLSMS